jgi:hypothetical protein
MPILGFIDNWKSAKARKPQGFFIGYQDVTTDSTGAASAVAYDGISKIDGVWSSAGKVTFDNSAKTLAITGGHVSAAQRVYFQLNPMLNP